MPPVIETLERRRLLSVSFNVAFTDDGTYAAYYDRIRSHLLAAGAEWAKRFVSNASIEIDVQFSPTITRAGGRSTGYFFYKSEGGYNIAEDGAVRELRTGVDPNGPTSDVEIFFEPDYLINQMWFDPNPAARTATVPSNRIDAMSVCLHELGHAFGFNGYRDNFGALSDVWMSRWDSYVVSDGQNLFFNGPSATAAYGADVPVTWGNRCHIANNAPRPGSDLIPDLMNGIVFYFGRRYYYSDLDLAVLKDVGVPVAPRKVTVTGRHVFYNDSAFDARNPAPNIRDVAAVATDKRALLPGEDAGFDNVTSYSKGINGVMIDFAGTPRPLTAADFEFRVGPGGDPAQWGRAPAPAAMTLLAGPAGTDTAQCLITWPTGAIKNQWLQVTVKADQNTGLQKPDVFYFGNLVGETGFGAARAGTVATVGTLDLLMTRRAAAFATAAIDNPFDFDRSGAVNALDLVLCRSRMSQSLAEFSAPAALTASQGAASQETALVAASAAALNADVPPPALADGPDANYAKRYLLALMV
jgi:hypothetical protein